MEIFSLKYIYYIFDVNNRESFLYIVLNGTLLNDAPIEALPERSSLAPTRRGIHCKNLAFSASRSSKIYICGFMNFK